MWIAASRFSGKELVIENDCLRIAFDQRSGALTDFTGKRTGWHIQRDPRWEESFRIFAPTRDRSFNPALGARNHLASSSHSADRRKLTLSWHALESEYSGVLDVSLTGTVWSAS